MLLQGLLSTQNPRSTVRIVLKSDQVGPNVHDRLESQHIMQDKKLTVHTDRGSQKLRRVNHVRFSDGIAVTLAELQEVRAGYGLGHEREEAGFFQPSS